jgi:ubiquitin-conjugating enzyme E2 variant
MRRGIFDATARAPRRSLGAVVFDAASVGLSGLAAAFVVGALARSLHASDVLAVAMAVPVGLLVADLVSAVAHWFCDTFFDSKTPLLGAVIGPFRLHHHDPDAFRRHDVCERNRNNCLAALPLLALVHCLTPRVAETGRPFVGAMLAVVAIALASATQIHAWAHDRHAPGPVRWLQRCGILLSRERHARHHREAHDRSYGIVNGWVNGALDRTGFFRRGSAVR